MRIFYLGLLLLLSVGSASLEARQKDYSALSERELERYQGKLERALVESERALNRTLERMSRNVSPAMKLGVETAAQDLEIKSILLHDFRDDDVLRSDDVRDELLEVMETAGITERQLRYLRGVVRAERAKIAAYDAVEAADEVAAQEEAERDALKEELKDELREELRRELLQELQAVEEPRP